VILKKQCPICGEVAIRVNREEIAGLLWSTYQCGHTEYSTQLKSDEYNITSSDGKELYPFQQKGVEFIINANGRALILDEMGLGKTVQALAFLKLCPQALPALICCKSSLTYQWMHEIIRWCGDMYLPQVIESSYDFLVPGFKTYICSMDLLYRFTTL
jgi:superfamily II DNA or RNA helicase